ncbi:MAG: family 2 glycosyl transferase [Candidatus Omnitrophica bacterium]|nr:family 2 glycosyl transferase [Candidatus Omnitrophota bacterium]
MISIVCIYNNEIILQDWLLKSLKNQTAEFELIKIDNTKNRFKSAAETLNYGGRQVKGKYIMFVHQDVDLCSNSWLEDTEKILDSISNLGIAGVIGVCEIGDTVAERILNVIRHGDNQRLIGNPIIVPEHVQTLDEQLLIIPKDVFQKYQFDEKTCDGWHLYGVDYCLIMGSLGFEVYAIPMFVQHKSDGASIRRPLYSLPVIFNLGPMVKEYYSSIDKVLKKHKNNYKWVYTTCAHGKWSTSRPLIFQRILHLIREYSKGLWNKIKRLVKL